MEDNTANRPMNSYFSSNFIEPGTAKTISNARKSRKRCVDQIRNNELKLPLQQPHTDASVDGAIVPIQSTRRLQQQQQHNHPTTNIQTLDTKRNAVDISNHPRWTTHNRYNHNVTATTTTATTTDTEGLDPVSDFDDSEWTPMDSSYGAAIPLAGWIPKGIRRTIEFTVLAGIALMIVFWIVETSVRSSSTHNNNYNKSSNYNNNNNNATIETTMDQSNNVTNAMVYYNDTYSYYVDDYTTTTAAMNDNDN
jgi:hypothetical protein